MASHIDKPYRTKYLNGKFSNFWYVQKDDEKKPRGFSLDIPFLIFHSYLHVAGECGGVLVLTPGAGGSRPLPLYGNPRSYLTLCSCSVGGFLSCPDCGWEDASVYLPEIRDIYISQKPIYLSEIRDTYISRTHLSLWNKGYRYLTHQLSTKNQRYKEVSNTEKKINKYLRYDFISLIQQIQLSQISVHVSNPITQKYPSETKVCLPNPRDTNISKHKFVFQKQEIQIS